MSSGTHNHPLIEPFLESDRLSIARVDIRFNSGNTGTTPRQIYLAFEKKGGCCRPVVTVTVSEAFGTFWRKGPMVEHIETIEHRRRQRFASEVWRKLEEFYGQKLFFLDTTKEGKELVRSLGYDVVNTESDD